MATHTTTQVSHYHVQKKRRADFIEEWRRYQKTVVALEDAKMVETERGTRVGVYVGADGDRPTRSMDALAHEIDPGVTSTIHRHSWDAMVLVVAGRGWTEIDGERIDWGPGDSLHLPAWAWHRSGNDGDVTARYLTFSSEPLLETMGMSIIEDAGHTPISELPARPGLFRRGQRGRPVCPAGPQAARATSAPGGRAGCTPTGTSWSCCPPRVAPGPRFCSTVPTATRPRVSPWRCSRSAPAVANRCTGTPGRRGCTFSRGLATAISGPNPKAARTTRGRRATSSSSTTSCGTSTSTTIPRRRRRSSGSTCSTACSTPCGC